MRVKELMFKVVASGAAFVAAVILSGRPSLAAGIGAKANGEFVTISGKVADVKAKSFQLKTNGTTIRVEMDDFGWDADGYKLVNGDQVVVTGKVDEDFLEERELEAGTVYVKSLNTYYYASSMDEEDSYPFVPYSYTYVATLPDNAYVDIQGKVVSENGRKFTIDTGWRKVTVDTGNMPYNPLDNVGYTKIDKGDRVRVSGRVDDNFFKGKEVVAGFVSKIP